MKKTYTIYIVSFILFFLSCDENRVFDKNEDLKVFEWPYEKEMIFEVDITDAKPKNVLINFRHTFYFQTRNVLMKVAIENPKGEKEILDINIPLAEPDGTWHATCAGDICDLQHLIDYDITDTGKYFFKITQDMRVNPLTDVMSIGLRVEYKTDK